MCEILLTVVLMILPSKLSLKRSIPSSKRHVYMYGFKPRRSRLSKLNRQIGKHVTFTLLRVNSSYTNHITLTKALFFKRVQLKQSFSNSCKSSPKLQFRIVALYNKHMATHGILRADSNGSKAFVVCWTSMFLSLDAKLETVSFFFQTLLVVLRR